MKYEDLTKEEQEIYNKLLIGTAGKTIHFSEHGEPLYFNKKGNMLNYTDQVIQEMRNQGHIAIMHIVK